MIMVVLWDTQYIVCMLHVNENDDQLIVFNEHNIKPTFRQHVFAHDLPITNNVTCTF